MPDRCFIAVDVDDLKVKAALLQAQERLASTKADLKCVEEENIHITLRFLGEIPETMTAKVAELVKGISFPRLTLSFEGIGVFPAQSRPSVIWTGIKGDIDYLLKVFTTLEGELSSLGFERDRRPFQPHLTLCRVRSGRNRAQLIEVVRTMEGESFGSIDVNQIRLKRSVLTRNGPVYNTVAESKFVG